MESTSAARPALSRRTFLAAGATAATAAWLLGPALGGPHDNPLTRALEDAGRRLSVGFVAGVASLGDAVGRFTTPAHRLPAGDATIVGQRLRVRVHGLSPTTAADGLAPGQLTLDALLRPARHRGDPLPFHAWSLTNVPVPQASSPVGFAATAEAEPTFGFSLRHDPRPDVAADAALAIFSAGAQREASKLHDGLYLLGLAPSTWERSREVPRLEDPRWADLTSLVVTIHRPPAPEP